MTPGLPALNALLNATSALLAGAGFLLIRRGYREGHRLAMLTALTTSTLFLVSYLVYHARVGSVHFAGRGVIRTLYLAILFSHTILAAAVVPLVLLSLARALRGRFEDHRTIARITLPLWIWVSVSGVVVYWMLYRL